MLLGSWEGTSHSVHLGQPMDNPPPHHGSAPREVPSVEMCCRRERTLHIFHLLRSKKKKKTNKTDGFIFLIIKVECSGTPKNGLRTLQDLF